HILIAVPPSAAPTVAQQKENQATGLLGQLRAGGSFASLAQRYSEDPGSKTRGGLLAVGGRGQFVPPFEDAAWQLAPGGMTGLVRSSFGYHIIRRPPRACSRRCPRRPSSRSWGCSRGSPSATSCCTRPTPRGSGSAIATGPWSARSRTRR